MIYLTLFIIYYLTNGWILWNSHVRWYNRNKFSVDIHDLSSTELLKFLIILFSILPIWLAENPKDITLRYVKPRKVV